MVAAGSDRARRLLDGHLPGKLPEADAQRRRAAAGADGTRRPRRRFRAGAGQAQADVGTRRDAPMSRFAALVPELILSIGGTVLMMVAAFTGRRGSSLVSWLAVALLLGATALLVGAPSHSGPVFYGLVTEDLFASFGRAITYPVSAVASIAGQG